MRQSHTIARQLQTINYKLQTSLLANEPVQTHLAGSGKQQNDKTSEVDPCQLARTKKLSLMSDHQRSGEVNDQRYTGKACEQPQYDKGRAKKFGEDHQRK